MKHSEQPSVLSFTPHDFIPEGKKHVCDRRVAALHCVIRKALVDASEVSICIDSDGHPEAKSAILQSLQEVRLGSSEKIWSTIQGQTLTLSRQRPRVSSQDIQRNLHGHAGGIMQNPRSLLERADHCWDAHLLYAKAHVHEKLQKTEHRKLDPRTTESLLRGRSAEFILQMVLESYAKTFTAQGYKTAELMDRSNPLRLPAGNASDRQYNSRYTTFHNVEFHASESIGNRHVTARHRPMAESRWTLTEMDAALTTGFTEDEKKFDRLYLFDATTSEHSWREKMLLKTTKLADFIHDMKEQGIHVQLINVLMSDPERSIDTRAYRQAENAHVQGLSLPLGSEVDLLTTRTAHALGLDIRR